VQFVNVNVCYTFMSLPVNIINHTSVIPHNSSSYHETFDKIYLNKEYVYKISSISVKIDTCSLWNIRTTNIVTYVNNSSQTVTVSIIPGYYSVLQLTQLLLIITVSNNRASVNNTCTSCNMSSAPDIANIFKLYGDNIATGTTASEPVDVTNATSVIKLYSSLMQQTFGIKSSFCDCIIHSSMGLNNITEYNNLDISVSTNPNLSYINWALCDANDNAISLNTPVYINWTVSVFKK